MRKAAARSAACGQSGATTLTSQPSRLDEPAQQNGDDQADGNGAVGLGAEIASGTAADNEVDREEVGAEEPKATVLAYGSKDRGRRPANEADGGHLALDGQQREDPPEREHDGGERDRPPSWLVSRAVAEPPFWPYISSSWFP